MAGLGDVASVYSLRTQRSSQRMAVYGRDGVNFFRAHAPTEKRVNFRFMLRQKQLLTIL